MIESNRFLLIAGTLISSAVLAHHGPTTSGALYETDSLVQFDGEIVGVLWRMPHVRYRLGVEDENTLVVSTTDVDWPYFDTAGTPQSDQISFVERFTMTADRSRLDYAATATDPVMFTAPVELAYSWAWAPGETLQANDCIEWEDVE